MAYLPLSDTPSPLSETSDRDESVEMRGGKDLDDQTRNRRMEGTKEECVEGRGYRGRVEAVLETTMFEYLSPPPFQIHIIEPHSPRQLALFQSQISALGHEVAVTELPRSIVPALYGTEGDIQRTVNAAGRLGARRCGGGEGVKAIGMTRRYSETYEGPDCGGYCEKGEFLALHGQALELGEELETKSGSSHTSARGSLEFGLQTTSPFSATLSLLDRTLAIKRLELAEEQSCFSTLTSHIAILEQEHQSVQSDLQSLQFISEQRTAGLTGVLQWEANRLSWLKSRVSRPSASFFPIKKPPPKPSTKRILSSLEGDICVFLSDLEAWQASVHPVMTLVIAQISSVVSSVIPGADIQVYGSFANRLHLPSSDIDLLVVPPTGRSIYETLSSLAATCETLPWVSHCLLITQAYIPVLQLVVGLGEMQVRVDLTVYEEKHRGLLCTEIVKDLAREIDMLRGVFLTLKQIFHVCEANVTYRGGLGSYSLFLMTAALMKREGLRTPGEFVFRFFQYYGYEFEYTTAIAPKKGTDKPMYPQALIVLDPSAPAVNTARATYLPFLLVSPTQHFLRTAATSMITATACNCGSRRRVMLKMMQEARLWVRSMGRDNFLA